MAELCSRWIAEVVQGHHHGAEQLCTHVITDSRKPCNGALFVALVGERFDGHQFLAAAHAHGAVAALVQHPVAASTLTQIVVPDTLAALGQLATAWRQQQYHHPLIALTGSNGKTTLKEMLRAILSPVGPTLATEGNLNNHIGVPLTLLRLEPQHRYAVIEMGANHPGEIAYLTELALPDVAIVNNAGPCHLEGFVDLPGVARAKGEIYRGLSVNGCAIINADDEFASYWRTLYQGRCIDFGFHAEAAVRGETLSNGQLRLHWQGQTVDITLALLGVHNQRNALAAAAAALALGLDLATIAHGLQQMQPVGGRLQTLRTATGAVLINDSYNANPASLAAALDSVSAQPRWLILGDMGELGADSLLWHAKAGAWARDKGYARLFALGERSLAAVNAFGTGAQHFSSADALAEALQHALAAQHTEVPTLLIKGSRSMRLERIVDALIPTLGTGEPH